VKQEENISYLRRVLCVEDDHDTCDVLRFVMTDYEFTAVHSIEDARKMIGKGSYDLYVLDNWLPDGSGIELCEKIRADGNRRPIVFTSAIGQRQEIELAMNAGADRYLVKPYEPETLLRIVKELLDTSSQLAVKS
jgi:two-component system alkaline phosphatase synthesis response regulator PhoP